MGKYYKSRGIREESILDRETSTLRIETFLSAIPNLEEGVFFSEWDVK